MAFMSKAIAATVTVFLLGMNSKYGVEFPVDQFWIEQAINALVAGIAVYSIPNKK